MSISRRLLPGLALVFAVGACEDDVEPTDELTMEESVAMVTAATATMSRTLADTTITPILVTADSIVYVVPCPEGGQARAALIPPADTALMRVEFRINPQGCVLAGGGLQFTLDGNPDFTYLLNIEITANFEFNFSGAITGEVSWVLGDRSGDCPIALTLEEATLNPVAGTVTGNYTGTLCGHEVEIPAASLIAGAW